MVKLTKLLIFSLLISFSLSFQTTDIEYKKFINTSIKGTATNESASYNISYNIGDITKNYIKIKIKSDENQFLFAYYSPISPDRSYAYLLNSGKGEIYLYINKAFTKLAAKGNIYLSIDCYGEICNFNLTSSEVESIDLERNSQYKYFTTKKKNLENTFIVKSKKEEIQPDYISFFASGNKNIQMEIKYVSNNQEKEITSNSFDYGKYAIFKEEGVNLDNNYYIIKITAPANSLITFGNNVNTYDKKELNRTKLIVNTNEIYGVLTKESNIQCFDFNIEKESNSYLSILDFNKNLKINFTDMNGTRTSTYSENGIIAKRIKDEFRENNFCLIRKKKELNEDSPFSLQITSDIDKNSHKNIFSPQINGIFYQRFLEKGTSAFFTGLFSNDFKTELRYYLKKIKGYPEMHIVKCTTYPKCEYDINSPSSNDITPKEINNIFSYSIFRTDAKKLINQEQYILLVYCSMDLDCIFQTNFYTELDKIVLPFIERTYHTIMYQGENNFLIKLKGKKNVKQIYVNLLTYTGDISIKTAISETKYNTEWFLTGNKKYFVLDVKNSSEEINDEIYFTIKGELASFYSVDYQLITNDTDKTIVFEESGINYLETIEPEFEKKKIGLANRKKEENRNFLVNFFPLNCKIKATRSTDNEIKPLQKLGSLTQDVVSNSSDIYREPYYFYYMELIKMEDATKFKKNLCMVYLSSIEINTDMDEEYQKNHLLISESVISRVILNKDVPNIGYIYPHMNPKGYVAINFNWQTKSKVNISIIIEDEIYKKFETTHSQYIIIPENELRSFNHCQYDETKPNQVCSIIVQIKLDKEYYNDEPVMEFSIKSKEVIPAFIRKSMIRKDIVVGNYYQYFYTEVGIHEEGDINIKFDRGSGKVYGRIVSKDINENQGWMNRIILPDENNNDLIYNYYTKKLIYESNKTNNCTEGCFLLLKVEPNFSDDYYKNESIAYPITLSLKAKNANISSLTQDNITVVDIPLNEFIVGDTNQTDTKFNYFYSLFIPYDCEKLIIEFLCESSYIFINVGDKKPLINESDFHYKVMDKDGILEITKKEILDRLSNKTTIKNVQLTIAIGAQYFDDCNSSIYSFRIRAKRENEIELISLTSDQETLCKVVGKKDNCFFIISQNREFDGQNNFFFHAMFLPNVEFNYYAKEVPKALITNTTQDIIKSFLPTKENNEWSNNNSRANYLYIDNSEIKNKTDSCILLNLEVFLPYNGIEDNKTITLLHSIYSYRGIILPNPASAQLFLVNNNNDNNLHFKFDTKENNLLIRLKSVSGKGRVYWDKIDDVVAKENKDNLPLNSSDENTYFYFNDPGDSITLTFSTKEEEHFPLHFQNLNKNEGKDSNESPGFGFYCFYERLSTKENYNYVEYGGNSKYNFIQADFPFIFYSKIPDKNHTIDVNIQLISLIKNYTSKQDYFIDTESEYPIFPLYKEFIIRGRILDENRTYSKNTKPEIGKDIEKEMDDGEYEPTNKIFRIQLTREYIEQKGFDGNNYIYIRLDKGIIGDKVKFGEITMEISILPSNNTGYIVEKSKYIYGKIPDNEKYNRYELSRINKFYKFMRIEFSANSNDTDFNLSYFKLGDNFSDISLKDNKSDFNRTTYNGKTVTLIEFQNDTISSVIISIFHNKSNITPSNFIFKYDISDQNNFINIKPIGNNHTRYYERNTVYINLSQFELIPSGAKINYVFTLIKNVIDNEKLESISLIDSKAYRIYKKSITSPSNNITIFPLKYIYNNSFYYITIKAEVIIGNNYKELFSYSCIKNPTSYTGKEEERSISRIPKILLCVFGSVLLIGIIFFVYCCVLKRGNLKKSKRLEELNRKINSSSNEENESLN